MVMSLRPVCSALLAVTPSSSTSLADMMICLGSETERSCRLERRGLTCETIWLRQAWFGIKRISRNPPIRNGCKQMEVNASTPLGWNAYSKASETLVTDWPGRVCWQTIALGQVNTKAAGAACLL